MPPHLFNSLPSWLVFDESNLSMASWLLLLYGAFMWLACGFTLVISLNDERTLREVGVWVKPMKFMAATALFAWSTVWASHMANPAVTQGPAYVGICALIMVTSFFEVAYITYQGSLGAASHYNTSDSIHALLFGLMGLAAVGLTASQGWLAWEIWKANGSAELSTSALGVVIGLSLTFVLSTLSGFLLGGRQPPAGQGLPWVGWHLRGDVRPAHFLGVHAQQFIPLLGWLAERYLGHFGNPFLGIASGIYALIWALLAWFSLGA